MKKLFVLLVFLATASLWAQTPNYPYTTLIVPQVLIPGACTGKVVAADGTGCVANGGGSGTADLAGYTFRLSGGVYYAHNNVTGADDYSGTDAGVVIRSAITANSGVCGHLNFEPAIYNINSLAGIAPTVYGIGIPSVVSTGQFCEWTIEGDSKSVIIDQLGTGVQTTGVVFNITPTAVASVGGPTVTKIDGIIVFQPVTGIVSAGVAYKNIDVRFPDNQRGSEEAIDSTKALNATYENVSADFNIAQSSLAYPVTSSYGLIGISTTAAGLEDNYMNHVVAVGYDVCIDVQGENSVLLNVSGLNCDTAIALGRTGGAIYNIGAWLDIGWGEATHGLQIGPGVQTGAMLNIANLIGSEDTSGIWLPTDRISLTNPTYVHGIVTAAMETNNVGIINSPVMCNASGGCPNLQVNNNATPVQQFLPGLYTSAPTFSPVGGSYSSVQSVTITCATGVPYYSTNGSTSNAYSTPVSVNATTTINAGCFGTGYTATGQASATYTLPPGILASDNFPGSSLSANWTITAGSFAVASNAFTANSGTTLSTAYWNALSWPVSQYSQITNYFTPSTAGQTGPAVRLQSGSASGYFATAVANGCYLYKLTADVFALLGARQTCVNNPGDVLTLDAQGTSTTTLKMSYNGTTLLTYSDSTSPYTSGNAGIIAIGSPPSNSAGTWVGGTP